MRHCVLWIEEQADHDLAELAGPVYAEGCYDLQIASNATEASRVLCEQEFSAVVVDIRIPPGTNAKWRELYHDAGTDQVSARLGLHLLRVLFDERVAKEVIGAVPKWVEPRRFGVLTVEGFEVLEDDLKYLGVAIYRGKSDQPSGGELLETIERILGGA